MNKKFTYIFCASFFLLLACSPCYAANVIVNHYNYNHYNSVSADVRTSVSGQKVFFAHASVGGNIVAGMESLHEDDGSLYMLQNTSTDSSPPESTEEGVFYDYDRGNPGWEEKVTDFATYISNGWHASTVNVAINKFCYIDADADWETYRDSMESLESTYSGTIFVYMTMPLKTDENSEDGWLRQQFNENLRNWIDSQDGKYLLDIADIEAHNVDGTESTSSWEGNAYQTLQSGYTSDGGHLNEEGRLKMARSMYSLLALIADPTETPVPDTDQVLIWQDRQKGQSVYWRLADTGKLVDDNISIGWDYITDNALGTEWQMVEVEILNNQNVLFWQNVNTGKVVYWRLNDGYRLTDEDDSGWNYVSDQLLMNSEWAYSDLASTGSGNFLLWQNLDNGKVVYWKLNTASPTIRNNTQDDGWGYVDEEVTLNSNWRLAAAFYIADVGQMLTWQNQKTGKVVWWKLTDDCKLTNRTPNDGWGFVSEDLTLNSNWRLAGPVTNTTYNYLIWQNETNGEAVWWKLNPNTCVLLDRTQDSGWGYVSEEAAVNSNWRLAEITSLGRNPVLIWRNTNSGQVIWWKLLNSAKLLNLTQDSGWGFVSDDLTAAQKWEIKGVLK